MEITIRILFEKLRIFIFEVLSILFEDLLFSTAICRLMLNISNELKLNSCTKMNILQACYCDVTYDLVYIGLTYLR